MCGERAVGTGGYAELDSDVCPASADTDSRKCPVGFLAADILVTANAAFLDDNPAARVLFERVKLPVRDVSRAIERQVADLDAGRQPP